MKRAACGGKKKWQEKGEGESLRVPSGFLFLKSQWKKKEKTISLLPNHIPAFSRLKSTDCRPAVGF
ncbi:MAG TPA: hypothetical protein VMZ27_04600 [Candidatus Saccharimonadales bacterium]|nr:hypothetical protein [Candidatus Saccharimonadales bacterium]